MSTKDKFSSSNEDRSNSCRIENSSGFPIRVLNAFNESDQLTKTVYEIKLTLVKTTEGLSSIKEAEIKDVELTGNYFIEDGKKEPIDIYKLLFVDKTSLFPFSFSTLEKSNGSYPGKTVTSQEKKQMDLAFHFYKYTPPVSLLREEFIEAFRKDNGEDVASIDDFFQRTKAYKKVSFVNIKTVLSYVNNYPAIWADRRQTFTYYLYSSGLDKNMILDQAPIYEGCLTLERKEDIFSDSTIDLAKGYTITFKDPQGNTTPVKYNQGVFSAIETLEEEIDVTKDYKQVDIHLGPFFDKKSVYTGRSQDTETISLLVGKINGIQVLGVPTKQDLNPSDSASNDAQWSALRYSKISAISITTALSLVGLGLFIYGFTKLYGKYRDAKIDPSRVGEETRTIESGFEGSMSQLGGSFGGSIQNVRQERAQSLSSQRDVVRISRLQDEYAKIAHATKSIAFSEETLSNLDQVRRGLEDCGRDLHRMTGNAQATSDKLSKVDGMLTDIKESVAGLLEQEGEDSNTRVKTFEEAERTFQRMSEEAREGGSRDFGEKEALNELEADLETVPTG